ncbi:transmembrane protein 225 isoform X2 [Grammomys surdaster]|uniref:transmembrane protein 225 isoform X2 n=1 Tax=Grammomys surdaster TaxID=491861 RepID=UPI0010A04EA9|nr:transmembrane protein 225 isoform X2 [Grammomys surdaster]
MHIPNRSIQAANIFFSSGAILLLIVGFIMENWVELVPKVRKDRTTHSPWLGCCPSFWPEESLQSIRQMMMMTLNIAIYLNMVIGLQFTYMISQHKCAHLFIGFLSFFAGIFCFIQITDRCSCMKFCVPHTESKSQEMTPSTIQVVSLPPRSAMPRSIVHVHSVTSKEGTMSKPHIQSRRVTWAL